MPTLNLNGVNPNAASQPQSNKYQEAFARYSDQLAGLEKRGATESLTPSKFSAFDRSIDKFEAVIRRFEAKMGSSAGFDSRINQLRNGMGNMDAAYRVANALRLGNRGQRFAEDRSYTDLSKVQHELRRIENLIAKQERFATSPSAQAALERSKQAIYVARSRIDAGLSGNHPIVNKVGGALGSAGALLGNPIIGTALALAGTAIGAPVVANKMSLGLAFSANAFPRLQQKRQRCRSRWWLRVWRTHEPDISIGRGIIYPWSW